MTITALPTAPSTLDPATFAARADAWVAALSQFITEVNALNITAQSLTSWCGTATGTANALVLTPGTAATAYAAGQTFRFKSSASANTAGATVAVSGLAAIAINLNGAALVAGDIAASQWYQLVIDATLTTAQLSPLGAAQLTGSLLHTFSMLTAIVAAGAVSTPSITTTGDLNTGIYFPSADTLGLVTGGNEVLRLDSGAGANILTNTDSSSTTTGALKITGGVGIAKKLFVGGLLNLASTVIQTASANADWAVTLENTGTTGANGLYVNIGASATGIPFRVDKGGVALLSVANSGIVAPGTDNTQSCGSGALRWSTVFAGTGTINTSDAREKAVVRPLTAAEISAAKQLAGELGCFKFLSAIAAKGDAAREHLGMTVQRAIEIMRANGLDALAYGFICHDAWDDQFIEHPEIPAVAAVEAVTGTLSVVDEQGNLITSAVEAVAAHAAVEYRAAWIEQTQVAGDRYGFRTDELLLFIARGFDARLSALEAGHG